MRVTALVMSILGPPLTFLVGGLITALVLFDTPTATATPRGLFITALGAGPGITFSAVAVVIALISASRQRRTVWLTVLATWAILILAATAYAIIRLNSADFPWFFPLIALPLASLVYWIVNRE